MNSPLFDKKLLFVTGKGGVGKSTVSLAIALAGVQKGKKTLYISATEQNFISSLYGRFQPVGYEAEELEKNFWALTVHPKKSLHEYVIRQIKFEFLYRMVFENRVMRYFLDATPGLDDLLLLGKIIDLAQGKRTQPFDLVVVDLAATGHGFNMLRIPQVVKSMIPTGPLHQRAQEMDRLLHDQNLVSLLIVTLPEEMPVNETLELYGFYQNQLNIPLSAVFVNGLYPEIFPPASENKLKKWAEDHPSDLLRNMLACAQSRQKRLQLQKQQLERLTKGMASTVPKIHLPFIFEEEFGRRSIQILSRCLLEKCSGSSLSKPENAGAQPLVESLDEECLPSL